MASSTWESDYLNPDIDFTMDFRSSSAPPATGLLFADDEDIRGDSHYLGSSGLHNNIGRSMQKSPLDRPAEGTKLYDSYRSDRLRNLPLNRPAPRTAASDLSLSPPVDRRFLGEFRSQSAAPSLQSLGPPPGLERESDRVGTFSDSYLGSDESHMLLLGQRRAASTGVLGNKPPKSAHVRFGSVEGGGAVRPGAVRPSAKTLMDLIKEDVDSESPNSRGGYQDDYNHRNGDFREDRQQQRSQMYNQFPDGDDPYRNGDSRGYSNGDSRYPEPRNGLMSNGPGNFEDPMDHVSMRRGGPRNAYETMQPQNTRHQMAQPQAAQPQMMSRGQRMQYNDNRMQGGMDPQDNRMQNNNRIQNMQRQQTHDGIRQNNPYVQHVNMPGSQYEQQQQMYGSQMQSRVHPQVVPPGHTIFINPNSQPYGYMQYPQPVMPEGQQYVNIMPMQGGGGGQVQALGGAYAFWQPDGQTGGQTLTILNPNGSHGVPLSVANIHDDRSHGPQHTPPHGRSKEKNGSKSRRGGAIVGPRARNQGISTHDSLLAEFKSRKSHRDWTIREITGHVVDFCQDQNGSRFIQQRIEIGDLGEKEIVLQEVLPAVRVLRNDVFGNYVVQKLLDFGTPTMLAELYSTFQGEVLELSLQMYGCRVVQKALETLDEPSLLNLLPEFHNNVLSSIHDQNGNHVIQKWIQVVSQLSKGALANGDGETAAFFNEQIDFIVDDVLRNVASLSCHPYGCRVFQRILEHCVEPDKSRALDEIMECHRTLLDDQYGNYVIQHVLQYGRHGDREQILHFVLENGLLFLSRQKFASNVVEKLLKYGTDSQRKAVVREMLKIVAETTGGMSPNDVGCSVVLLMVRDAYANYVVQTTLDVISESQEKVQLLEELRSHSDELKSYTFAKHIVMKLEA
ncbi:unnamed protein product [Cylindrotheca closterium]|uniref:PUM-HD domain-containing protein n=1 Tax=Cylindrotheca closterium TaxID=2856 RepID=A0AAD2G3J8_9STRA|nr:unnamed protein product [Cylindrotheca closterium]